MTYCDIMMLNLIKVKFLVGEAREFGGEAKMDETLDRKVAVKFLTIISCPCIHTQIQEALLLLWIHII